MIEELFSEDTAESIRSEISASLDNEVFFVGDFDDNGLCSDIKVLARGNEFSVPAIIGSAGPGQIVVHNHPSGNLTPSEQDVHLASVFGNNGVGFVIVDNEVSDVYVVVEPFRTKENLAVDLNEAESYLVPDGPVSKVLKDSYEFRKEQVGVLGRVLSSFNNNGVELIEAGTGTGKTFSYLLPSILWALKNNERVVVSTNTINLQEQLISKDIPLMARVVPQDFRYSLVKGMSNYVCLLRAETLAENQMDLFEDDHIAEVNDLINWSKTTDKGSRSDLNFTPSTEVWDKISAESDSCIRAKCPHYSRCFFFKQRREVASSQLIVVNHHLFFSDLAIKIATQDSQLGVLPSYRRVVFDEAHNIVDVATSHFSSSVSKYGLMRAIRRLKNSSRKGEFKGLIYYRASASEKLSEKQGDTDPSGALSKAQEELSAGVDQVEILINESFDLLEGFSTFTDDPEGQSDNGLSIRIKKDMTARQEWTAAKSKFNDLKNYTRGLTDKLKQLISLIEKSEDEDTSLKILVEFRSVVSKLEYYAGVVDEFFSEGEDLKVKWVDIKKRNKTFLYSIGISPINVSDYLREDMYKNLDSAVLTSATLTIDKSFEFSREQLGLQEMDKVNEFRVESPFNYKEQAMLCVPTDVPGPDGRNYEQKITPYLKQLLLLTKGNALILFTSYQMLNEVYAAVKKELPEDISLLVQGTEPRNKLIDRFKRTKNSVLFATDSFWEGIDVPGDSLRLLVIMKLPFKVPTEPIFEAKNEYLESQGKNSFMEHSLPLAVIKFKQGFGRLIRSRKEKGVAVVFDRRVVTMKYGKYFINSLPDCNVVRGNFRDLLGKIEKFL